MRCGLGLIAADKLCVTVSEDHRRFWLDAEPKAEKPDLLLLNQELVDEFAAISSRLGDSAVLTFGLLQDSLKITPASLELTIHIGKASIEHPRSKGFLRAGGP